MGSDDGEDDTLPISSHHTASHSSDDHTDQPAAPYSYVKARLQRSRTEAANDIKSWATDGQKGHVLLVRNSRMLVANIIAERALESQLWNLSRERNECFRARDRDRQFFLRHLGLKGERFRDIVVKIESRKKVRPGTVHLPVFQRNGLLSHVHEYPLARRTSGVDGAEKPEALMVHPLPFMSAADEEEVERHGGNDGILPGTEVEPRFHKEERKSAQWIHSRRNLRSTSAIPATRGRYESCLPVRVPIRDAVTANVLRSSDLLQYTSVLQPENEHDLDLCHTETELEDPPKSCSVFSESPRRPVTAPESIHVARLIDEIDSLHVPSKNQKKAKARTDVLLKEIFRS